MRHQETMVQELHAVMEREMAEKIVDVMAMIAEETTRSLMQNSCHLHSTTRHVQEVFIIQYTNKYDYCQVCHDLNTVFTILSQNVSDTTFLGSETHVTSSYLRETVPFTEEHLAQLFEHNEWIVVYDDGYQTGYAVHKCKILGTGDIPSIESI